MIRKWSDPEFANAGMFYFIYFPSKKVRGKTSKKPVKTSVLKAPGEVFTEKIPTISDCSSVLQCFLNLTIFLEVARELFIHTSVIKLAFYRN